MFKDKLYIAILKRLIVPAIAIAIAASSALYFGGKLKNVTRDIAQQRTAALVLEKRVDRIASIKAQLAKINSAGGPKLENALPQSESLSDILASLRARPPAGAKQFEVRFEPGTVFAEKRGSLSIETVAYSITMISNASIAMQYIKTLESLPYFAPISELYLNSVLAPKGILDNNTTVRIRGKIYVKKT